MFILNTYKKIFSINVLIKNVKIMGFFVEKIENMQK